MTDVAERRKRQDKAGGWGETIRTVVYAVLIALVVRTFAIEPFNIPSGSMIPTLLVGDYLFVSKYSYGYSKHSSLFDGPLLRPHLRSAARARRRRGVQVSRRPGPGRQPDRLHQAHRRPAGRPHPGDERRAAHQRRTRRAPAHRRLRKGNNGQYQKGTLYSETLPNGRRYTVLEYTDNGMADNTPEFLVPAGNYFVMGDNRDELARQPNAPDAARLLGLVARSRPARLVRARRDLVGRAEFIFFSHDPSAAGWLEPWKWPQAIRWGRFFTAIH